MRSQTLETFKQDWSTDPLDDEYVENTGLMEDIAEAARLEISSRFDAKVDAEGTPWRDRVGESLYKHPKLDKTGDMKRAAIRGARSEGENIMSFGCIADEPFYAQFQQKGTKKMPARPFMNIAEEGEVVRVAAEETATIASLMVAGLW